MYIFSRIISVNSSIIYKLKMLCTNEINLVQTFSTIMETPERISQKLVSKTSDVIQIQHCREELFYMVNASS